jgi:hypothetical protein
LDKARFFLVAWASVSSSSSLVAHRESSTLCVRGERLYS